MFFLLSPLLLFQFSKPRPYMNENELIEHPEGGRYKEVFRSELLVEQAERTRSALTHIYFSLNADECSRFHKVSSDEIWNLYEGEGVYLYLWDEESNELEKIELSRHAREYCHVVKAGLWQATLPIKNKVLVGCSVAPGFEFEDFVLIEKESPVGRDILKDHPELLRLVG